MKTKILVLVLIILTSISTLISSIAFAQASGFYSININTDHLTRIDTNGLATDIGYVGFDVTWKASGMTYHNGILYLLTKDTLFSLNINSGMATPIVRVLDSQSNLPISGSITFDSNGQMYLFKEESAFLQGKLYTLNPSTGIAVRVSGNTSGDPSILSVSFVDSVLFGASELNDKLLIIDKTTGALTNYLSNPLGMSFTNALTTYLGNLYGLDLTNETGSDSTRLCFIDKTTGVATYKCTFHDLYTGLAYVNQASIPIFNCPGAFMSPQLANGLVGWWPFCGDADDESGNGNNGTVNGATLTRDRYGNANSAYEFDGNSVITVSNTTALNFSSPFSVSVWALKIGSEQTGHLLGKRNLCSDYQYQFGFDLSDPSFGVGWGGGGFGQFSYLQGVIPNFDTATWINYVGTFDGSNWKLYKNGISAGSLNAPLVNPVAADLLFGGSGSCQKFHGKLDDIGIWNRALDSSEVTQLYNTGLCTQTIAGSCDTLIFNANITGFNPVTYANTVTVYPNPAHDYLIVDCGTNYAGLNGYSIRITNILGQTQPYILPITNQVTNIQLVAPQWINGTYVVQLINPQGTILQTKVIVIQ